jgi:hypothetical protein
MAAPSHIGKKQQKQSRDGAPSHIGKTQQEQSRDGAPSHTGKASVGAWQPPPTLGKRQSVSETCPPWPGDGGTRPTELAVCLRNGE